MRIPGAPPGIDSRLQDLASRYGGFYVGDVSQPRVALTFDVATAVEVPALLDVLERHGVSATFFLTGEWVEATTPSFNAS